MMRTRLSFGSATQRPRRHCWEPRPKKWALTHLAASLHTGVCSQQWIRYYRVTQRPTTPGQHRAPTMHAHRTTPGGSRVPSCVQTDGWAVKHKQPYMRSFLALHAKNAYIAVNL